MYPKSLENEENKKPETNISESNKNLTNDLIILIKTSYTGTKTFFLKLGQYPFLSLQLVAIGEWTIVVFRKIKSEKLVTIATKIIQSLEEKLTYILSHVIWRSLDSGFHSPNSGFYSWIPDPTPWIRDSTR